MNRKEAEDFVYESYLKAEKFQEYDANDSEKRRPDLTKELIRSKCKTPNIVITGSKGKGSVANMISQILQSNYKVGLMTSPHLVEFNERFRINGKQISDADFIKYISLIQSEINMIDKEIPSNVCISPMGIQADMALEYFNDNKTDINIFECGKGVKYDDVNNVIHQYAVINSIFLEHTRELGSTYEAIAQDKSCIINGEQELVFVAEQKPEVLKIIMDKASEYDVSIMTYGKDFSADNIRFSREGMIFDVEVGSRKYEDIVVPLLGEHQAKNCALAMAMCLSIMGSIDIVRVKNLLLKINWPGRMEVLSSEPLIILDACINSESCKNVKSVIESLGIKKVNTIIGIPDDKDYLGVAKEMNDISNSIVMTKSHNKHYVFTNNQIDVLKNVGIDAAWSDSILDAITKAKSEDFPIVILGTTSVISEVKIAQLDNQI